MNSALLASGSPPATLGRITAALRAGLDDDGDTNVLYEKKRAPCGAVRLKPQFSSQAKHMNSQRNKLLALTLAASLASFFTSGCNDGTRGNSASGSGTSGASGSGTSATSGTGATGSSTLELSVHVRAHPAPGWLACRATTRYVINGYHEEDFEIWDSTGTLVAQSRQLALLPG